MRILMVLGALTLCACNKPTPSVSESGGPSPSSVASSKPVAAASAPAAPPSAPAAAPDVVAKRYLELGAAGDLSKVSDLVDPACAGTKVGEVDAVRMMGARMTLTETTTSIESQDAAQARVKYSVKGSIDAKDARTETDLLGKKVEIRASSMTMSGVTQSGTLTLKKAGERWVISCK
jgi:hypothetical protein